MSPGDGIDALLQFLAPRAVPGVEVVDVGARRYARALGGRVVTVDAAGWSRSSTPDVANLDHRASETGGNGDATPAAGPAVPRTAPAADAGDAASSLARVLAGGPDEAAAAHAHLRGHPLLRPLADPDLRVPGHPDGAELAVRAVLGQQVSVAAARTLAGRLAEAHGLPVAGEPGPDAGRSTSHGLSPRNVLRSFPSSAALAALDPESLPMPRARGRALVGLAVALAAGDVDLSRRADPAAARDGLLALRGIGPWTADYVLLRALRAPDVLLVGDLGVLHALRALGADTSRAGLRRLAQEVAPFGSYATVALWRSLHV